MAIVWDTNTNTTAATRTNTTVTKPTGTVDGDVVLLILHIEDDIAPTATGFTQIANVDHPSVAMDLFVWYKVASGEGASWTITHASSWTQGAAIRVTGVDTADVIDTATSTTNTGTSTTGTALSITTDNANAGLSAFYETWEAGSSWATYSSPLVEELDASQFAAGVGVQAAAGASGNKTATPTFGGGGLQHWATVFTALREASAGAAATYPSWHQRGGWW